MLGFYLYIFIEFIIDFEYNLFSLIENVKIDSVFGFLIYLLLEFYG